MKFLKENFRISILWLLLLANLSVYTAVYARRADTTLNIYFLDVGQGDSIFIESPSKGRILIDGGVNSRVLSELGEILSFGDRRIDVVIASHPDADHIGGLIDVLNRYEVGAFIEPGVESDNKIDDILDLKIQEKNIPNLLARRGMRIVLGGGAEYSILFPDRDVSLWEMNDTSIVGRLVFGEQSFLLTGDATKKTEYTLLAGDKSVLDSDVMQVGHHGSRTSTSLIFVEAVSPQYAVISAGKDNSYGHPHADTLATLNKIGAEILGTYDLGTIEFETNGETLEVK